MGKKHKPLSHSARSDYQTCPRKFYLGREQRLELADDKVSLRMGAGFTLALEHRDPERALEGYKSKCSIPILAGSQEEIEVEQTKLMAELYLEHYGTEEGLKREVKFYHDMLGKGFLDGIIECDQKAGSAAIVGGGRPYRIGVEDKFLTAGFWRTAEERRLAIDQQVTAYFAAMRDMGTPLDKLLYRVTFKPTIKPDYRKGKDGNLQGYLKRLRDKVKAEPDKAFKQYELYRSSADLDRFLEEAAEVNAQVKLSRRVGAWPRNTGACTMYGSCVFLDICRDDPGIEHKYRVRPELPKLTKAGK